jgi:CheY-like chemotaxis protein
MSRQLRIVVSLQTEFTHEGVLVRAITADLSRTGVFVRTEHLLPRGEIISLRLVPPAGDPVELRARVAHVLGGRAAKALARHAGMGLEFVDDSSEAMLRLDDLLARVIEGEDPVPDEVGPRVRVLVVDPGPRMCDRIAEALGGAGFDPESAPNGQDAIARASERPPQVVITADAMPIMDGWTLISRLGTLPGLAELPILMMADDAGELNRLRAYRAGVADFMPRPFTNEELIIRTRRLASGGRRSGIEPPALRGALGEIAIGTLLSFLEFERKSGVLAVWAAGQIARIFVAEGRIVRVEATLPGKTAYERMMMVLDLASGHFEFTACEIQGQDELGLGTQRLLLEHAKAHDEAEAEAEAGRPITTTDLDDDDDDDDDDDSDAFAGDEGI